MNVGGRTVLVHRYVYEQAHGPIPPRMHVHHRNEDPFDNRLENLQLLTPAQHSRLHNDRHPRTKFCEVCGEEYEPAPTKRKRAKTCSPSCRSALLAAQKTTPADRVEAIRADLAAGMPHDALKAKHRAGNALIQAIRRGQR